MQDDQQLPRAPPALIYSICFSSLSAVTGSCLSERDLGFRGSDTCQMSFGVCAAKIVPLDILLLFFFFLSALLHANHIFHLSGSGCIQQHSMHDDPSSASCIRRSNHPFSAECSCCVGSCCTPCIYVSLCASDSHIQTQAFRFLFGHFTFSTPAV